MLYVIGTPIGNLQDISIRQARTILSCDILLAENTGSAGILLQQIPILFPEMEGRNEGLKVVAFHKDNEYDMITEVLSLLKEDKEVGLISESGMPLISDPGNFLIKQLIKEEIPFEVIPGPTAVDTALVYSGFDSRNSVFLGFLPKKPQDKKKIFEGLKTMNHSCIVFYESPFRTKETMEVLNEVAPDSQVVICRELTKKFEEVLRGKPGDLMEREYKGEITVVMRLPQS